MKKIICAFTLLTLAAAPRVRALETVAVPLPGIEGRYWIDTDLWVPHYSRSVHIELERIPTAVQKVWIHITGTFTAGEYYCDLGGPPPPQGPFPIWIVYLASMKDSINGGSQAASSCSPETSGPFEYTSGFSVASGDASWVFMTTGRFDLNMKIDILILIPECWITIWPEATIESAELLIEGEFPVAVEPTTWGAVKALFR